MTTSLDETAWPAAMLGEALLALARSARLPHQAARVESPPARLVEGGPAVLGSWLEAAAEQLGLEAEPAAAPYGEWEGLLRRCGPALLRLAGPGNSRYLAVLRGEGRSVVVLGPDLARRRVRRGAMRAALCSEVEATHVAEVDALLAEAGLDEARADRARSALLAQRLAGESLAGCWLVRAPGGAPTRWGRWLVLLLSAHTAEQSCWVLAWWLLGWLTFRGRLDAGWLAAWLLVLASLVPMRLLGVAAGGRLSLELGSALRRRLLAGALRLDPDRVRAEGAGELLGRVLEAEAIEQLALGGGLLGLASLVELFFAALVLGVGAGSWAGVSLLVGAVALAGGLGLAYHARRRNWTDERLALTNDLVERMVGHRTRLAQQARARWHEGEDQALEQYLGTSARLDRAGVFLQVLVPRGWLLAGLLVLAPPFVTGRGSVTELGVALGGLLLARQGLQRLVEGLERLVGAAVAWRRLRPFVGERPLEPVGQPDLAAERPAPAAEQTVLLEGRELTFRHAGRSEAAVRGVDLVIGGRDRLLLEGPSGGGKSTLAALLAGLRSLQAGSLLLRGLDRQTLGATTWRRRVVLSPQFHHNHVLVGSFLYNLLLGRTWPPERRDVEEAERLCRQLDLGALLERMPGGLHQMVGETGWQLSHGERSRLFLARALLQGAELVLLDESFAALDPQTLARVLEQVLQQAPALLVIAHP
jgi:ATP-binding cassette subfamily B protein